MSESETAHDISNGSHLIVPGTEAGKKGLLSCRRNEMFSRLKVMFKCQEFGQHESFNSVTQLRESFDVTLFVREIQKGLGRSS